MEIVVWKVKLFLGEDTNQATFQDLVRILSILIYSTPKTFEVSVQFLSIGNFFCNTVGVVEISHLPFFCTIFLKLKY